MLKLVDNDEKMVYILHTILVLKTNKSIFSARKQEIYNLSILEIYAGK